MKRSTLAFASIAAIALAMPLAAQAGPGKGHRGHGAHLVQMDANADGTITRAEADAALAARFATIDANSDSFVTRDEMKAHHEAKRAQMKANWEARKAEAEAAGKPVREGKMKRDKDPAKAAEWQAKKAERAAEHWAAMDTDGDGRLSAAEFTAEHMPRFEQRAASARSEKVRSRVRRIKGWLEARRDE